MSIDTFPHSDDRMSMPGGPMVGENLPESTEAFLSTIQGQLVAEGEPIDAGWLRRQFGDSRIAEGLVKVEVQTGVPAVEYIRQSYRYSQLDPQSFMYTKVTIPASADNLRDGGRERREETGYKLDLDAVRTAGVDPSKVLYWRATQRASQPKPEYYWTSDSLETRTGLRRELGGREKTALVLAASLEEINKNGGLMSDINDDAGIAVRQIGLGNFDQRQVLFAFGRSLGSDEVITPETLHDDAAKDSLTAVPPSLVDDPGFTPDDDVW